MDVEERGPAVQRDHKRSSIDLYRRQLGYVSPHITQRIVTPGAAAQSAFGQGAENILLPRSWKQL